MQQSTKNGRVVFAWRLPVMHFFVLFCLYKQAQFTDKKRYEVIPTHVQWIRQAKQWKQSYWEEICDLKNK